MPVLAQELVGVCLVSLATFLSAAGRVPQQAPDESPVVGDYDNPPKPIKITQPTYPREAFEKQVEGTVVLEIWIDTKGKVSRVQVLESIPLLDKAAISCVKKWRFKPAVKDGRPVLTAARAPIAFRISASFSGRVVEVDDGDTISVMRDGRAVQVRLAGVDCPERGQDFSEEARRFTSEQVLGKVVLVNEVGREEDERLVARVLVGNNRDVSLALLEAGLAWHFTNDAKKALAEAEAEARASRRGLWSRPEPVPPWRWREGGRGATSAIPSPDIGCGIKGSVNRDGERVFHVPGSRDYDQTGIDPTRGERWFSTVEEARAAGWTAAKH